MSKRLKRLSAKSASACPEGNFLFKVLFLCTENACRSQMAEGLINHDLQGEMYAFSAGVRATGVNLRAIQVMAEIGIDISGQRSTSLDEFMREHSRLLDRVVWVRL